MAASRRSGGSSIRTLRALFGAGVTVTFITSEYDLGSGPCLAVQPGGGP